MNQLLSQFLKYLRQEKGRSPQTVANYDFYLSRFLSWSKIKDPKQINAKLIKNYQLWLTRQTSRAGRPLEKSTQNYHLIALRSFLKFLKEQKKFLADFREVKLNRTPSRAPKTLPPAELESLLAAPRKKGENEIVRLRDKALLEVLFSAGLKVAALSELKKEQIDLNGGVINFEPAGVKYKLSNQGKYYLKQYLAKRRDGSPFLFVREDKAKGGDPPANLTPRSIQRIVKNYAGYCGLRNKVTPQIIRQTVINCRNI